MPAQPRFIAGNALLSGGYLLTNPSSRIVHISKLLYNYKKYQNLMMRNLFYLAAALLILVSGCGSPALDNFSDVRYELTNQDNEPVVFPDDFRGKPVRSEEHTSELQSRGHLVCRLLLESSFVHSHLHSFPTRRSSDLNYKKYQNLMMRNLFYLAAALLILVSGCGSPALDNFSDVRYELTNQDNEPVVFPDDFRGKPVVIGFIYTHCPDICSFITANIGKVRDEIPNPESAHFVLVTFDPERDTPEVLKNYANAFGYTGPEFQFLTGEPDVIDEMMERVGVRLQESYTSELESGEVIYFLSHSDKIMLIDQKSRLIFDYGGSMTPPAMIIEDLEKL